jgi:hypothetical protein
MQKNGKPNQGLLEDAAARMEFFFHQNAAQNPYKDKSDLLQERIFLKERNSQNTLNSTLKL